MEQCSKLTSHHLDPSDLPGHANTDDGRFEASRKQIFLATNRNSGMLQPNASSHDDDDDDDKLSEIKAGIVLTLQLF